MSQESSLLKWDICDLALRKLNNTRLKGAGALTRHPREWSQSLGCQSSGRVGTALSGPEWDCWSVCAGPGVMDWSSLGVPSHLGYSVVLWNNRTKPIHRTHCQILPLLVLYWLVHTGVELNPWKFPKSPDSVLMCKACHRNSDCKIPLLYLIRAAFPVFCQFRSYI